MSRDEKSAWLKRMNEGFCERVPHNKAIGLKIVDFYDDGCLCRLDHRSELDGSPGAGSFHFGVIASLLDAASGAAAFIKLKGKNRVATLDLRVDYPVASPIGETVWARATCYQLNEHVAFTRAVAYTDDEGAPISTAMGTFRVFRKQPDVR